MLSITLDGLLPKRTAFWAVVCLLGSPWLATSWAQRAGSGTRGAGPPGYADRGDMGRTPTLNLSGATAGGRYGETPAAAEMVVGVRVEGNKTVSLRRIEPHVKTRPGKPFDLDTIKGDVRRLSGTRLFVDVQTFKQQTPDGLVVVFRVIERPVLQYVKYLGNQRVKRKQLVKESGLKPGDPLDPYAVSEAKKNLVEYYAREGLNDVRVTIIEGNRADDRGAVFLINETAPQKVWRVDFVGNKIASDSRLATQIRSKPPFTRALYLLPFSKKSGVLNRDVLDDDVKRLEQYYRNLGFARARIGREVHADEGSGFVNVTFVIDEGPRYLVRNITVIGNDKISSEEIMADLKLKPGDFFNQTTLNADLNRVRKVYGSYGYSYADIRSNVIDLAQERPGELDLVYKINEGERYRVGPINIHVGGDNPHTRITTILNRLTLRPGDIADQRKVEASMVNLRRSALFARDQPGVSRGPRSAFRPPEETIERRTVSNTPRGGSSRRFQSPDDQRARNSRWPQDHPYWHLGSQAQTSSGRFR